MPESDARNVGHTPRVAILGGHDEKDSSDVLGVCGASSLGVPCCRTSVSRSAFDLTCTLRASLSGTFLQTLPDLVTPLEGALFISAQLSTDPVSALRKVWLLI